MMLRLVVVCGVLWGMAQVVFAEAAPAVVNDAPATVTKVQAVVNALGPGFDELYNFTDGEWREGVSASLFNIKSRKLHLASIRLGYSHQDELVYNSLRLDLPGLSQRFIPDQIKGVATTGYLKTLWAGVGKYGSVGPFVGYGFDDDAVAWGLTLGGQVSF